MRIEPLSLTDSSLLRPSAMERWAALFPIIGWCVGASMQFSRIQTARALVQEQLNRRRRFDEQCWLSEGIDATYAEQLSKVIANSLDWDNWYFSPDDPLELLLLEREGVGYMLVSQSIEQEFEIEFSEEPIPIDGPLKSLVSVVDRQKGVKRA